MSLFHTLDAHPLLHGDAPVDALHLEPCEHITAPPLCITAHIADVKIRHIIDAVILHQCLTNAARNLREDIRDGFAEKIGKLHAVIPAIDDVFISLCIEDFIRCLFDRREAFRECALNPLLFDLHPIRRVRLQISARECLAEA